MQEQSIDKNEQLSFVNLALALASDYISIYVIDSNDDSYVEYVPPRQRWNMSDNEPGTR